MTFSPLGSYIAANGPLHRLRPGAKLVGLFAFAAAAMALRSASSAVIALAIALGLALLAGMRWRGLARVTLRFAVVGAILFTFQAWQNGWERGIAVVGTLFALILAASALTASTAVNDLTDTITWALRPFRRLGVHPEQVALAFSLALTAIPTVLALAQETHAAAKARGLERSPRAYLVPFVLRVVAHAQLTGEALQARGIGDD